MTEEQKTQIEPDVSALQSAIDNFKKIFGSRSFSGRHPELGTMVNCGVCGRRHRSSIVCDPVYSAEAKPRHRLIPKAKRYNPHHNQYDLQLIEKTREVTRQNVPRNGAHFPLLSVEQLMRTSRSTAEHRLDEEREKEAKRIRRQQDVSRRINRGLLPGGSR